MEFFPPTSNYWDPNLVAQRERLARMREEDHRAMREQAEREREEWFFQHPEWVDRSQMYFPRRKPARLGSVARGEASLGDWWGDSAIISGLNELLNQMPKWAMIAFFPIVAVLYAIILIPEVVLEAFFGSIPAGVDNRMNDPGWVLWDREGNIIGHPRRARGNDSSGQGMM